MSDESSQGQEYRTQRSGEDRRSGKDRRSRENRRQFVVSEESSQADLQKLIDQRG